MSTRFYCVSVVAVAEIHVGGAQCFCAELKHKVFPEARFCLRARSAPCNRAAVRLSPRVRRSTSAPPAAICLVGGQRIITVRHASTQKQAWPREEEVMCVLVCVQDNNQRTFYSGQSERDVSGLQLLSPAAGGSAGRRKCRKTHAAGQTVVRATSRTGPLSLEQPSSGCWNVAGTFNRRYVFPFKIIRVPEELDRTVVVHAGPAAQEGSGAGSTPPPLPPAQKAAPGLKFDATH